MSLQSTRKACSESLASSRSLHEGRVLKRGTKECPAAATHCYRKGVAVWDFIVDDCLDVDGFQLELDGDINQPAREKGLMN